MTVELLDRILEAARVGETTDWEFKSGKGGFPRSFWQTYSAMANSEGGTVLLGASEKDGALRLDRLTLEQVRAHPEETLRLLREQFGGKVERLSPAELQALATAEIEGAVSNARLQDLLADHPVDITRMLGGLCERGLLVSDSRRRWTTYRLGGGSTAPLFEGMRGGPGDSSGTPPTPDVGAGTPDPPELPEEEAAELRRLAEPVATRERVKPTVMHETIELLCRGRFLSAEQLASLLRRNPEHLRAQYLTPMTRSGKLRLKYPESTNRPDQAYTAASRS